MVRRVRHLGSSLKVLLPFLILPHFFKVLSESLEGCLGCLPPGGHGERNGHLRAVRWLPCAGVFPIPAPVFDCAQILQF